MPNTQRENKNIKESKCFEEAAALMARAIKGNPIMIRKDVNLNQFSVATSTFAAEIASRRFEECMARKPAAKTTR